jgi:hypothetical protein
MGELPGSGGPSGGEPRVRVPAMSSVTYPLRPDLVADDELAGAGGSAEELLRGLVGLSGAHLCLGFSGHVSATVPLGLTASAHCPGRGIALQTSGGLDGPGSDG